jgi:hypothetical protein
MSLRAWAGHRGWNAAQTRSVVFVTVVLQLHAGVKNHSVSLTTVGITLIAGERAMELHTEHAWCATACAELGCALVTAVFVRSASDILL